MTEIASIAVALNTLANTVEKATHQFIATVEAHPQAFAPHAVPLQGALLPSDIDALAAKVQTSTLFREVAGRICYTTLAEEFTAADIAEHVDASTIASEISLSDLACEIDLTDLASEIDTDALADRAAREVRANLDEKKVAAEISLSDLANEISVSDLAGEFSARDIADEIDLDDLRDKVVDSISSDIDTAMIQEAVAEQVADDISAADIANEIDTRDIARAVVDEIDMDDLAARLFEDKANLDTVLDALAKRPEFIAAVAVEMAQMMLRGSKEPEPHGLRETIDPAPFVPASEGPDGEKFNTLQA